MMTMKRFLAVLIIVGGLASIFSAGADAAGKKKLPKHDLPAAVVSAFEKAYPKAVIKGIDKEKENGVTYYELETMDGKIARDFLYATDGTVFEMEETISATEIPELVVKTLRTSYADYKIVKAEKVTKGAEVSYELALKKGKAP